MSTKQWGSLGHADPDDALNGDAIESVRGQQRNTMETIFGKPNLPAASSGGGMTKWILILAALGGGYFVYTKYMKKGRRR